MENFIYEYYIGPIWSHSGYNIVNTLTYAIIAVIAIYAIHRFIKGRIKVDTELIKGALSFVLFGSTIRVVTDSIDGGVFKPVTPIHQLVLDSHIWDYGYLTVTPGIYIVTGVLFLASLGIQYRLKRPELLPYIGLALWLPHFLLLIPFMGYAIYALPILLLAAVPAYLAWIYFKDKVLAAIVAGQALDGAATFFAIEYFHSIGGVRYFEQHVLSTAVGEIGGTYFTFYLLKVIIAVAAAYVLQKEKMDLEDKYYIALVIMIMGFGPGMRDVLRMAIGG